MKKAYLSPVLLLVLLAGLVAGCAGMQEPVQPLPAPVTPAAVASPANTPVAAALSTDDAQPNALSAPDATAVQPAAATSVDDRVEALLAQMTLAEKIGQMTQAEKGSITPEDVTRSVIAGSLLAERELVFRRLQRMGVQIIETTPEQFGGVLISRYLQIKKRDML